jgi:hypothetical protein
MHSHLAEQWAQTQKELTQRVVEAEHIGDCLIELGKRLKQEPWMYATGWLHNTSPDADTACLIETEIEEPLDKHRLMWLLDEIRILRRREAELRKLVAA